MVTKMLKSRQKSIVDMIKDKNLIPAQFKFQPETNDFYLIELNESDFYFKTNQDGFHMRPGLNNKLDSSANAGGFGATLVYFEKWLTAIAQEMEIGNPW
ncbi:MAG: hypothetical protein EOO20_22570, partial [Chryseobacterium sp.]